MSRKRILVPLLGILCLAVMIFFLSSNHRLSILWPISETETPSGVAPESDGLNRSGAVPPSPASEAENQRAGTYRPGVFLKRGEEAKLEGFRMRGRVTTEEKQPVAGAEILVCEAENAQDCASSPWRAISANDGFYELRLPMKRGINFPLKVSGHGFATLEGRLRMESPGDLERNFVLAPALAWIRGQVVDPAGVPVEGGRVTVTSRNRRPDMAGSRGVGMAFAGGKREQLVTDNNGAFGADGFALGLVSVMAQMQGYRAAAMEVSLEPGENHVDLRLLPARIISIRVVDSMRQAVDGPMAFCRGSGERAIELEPSRPGLVTLKVDPQTDQCRCEFRAVGYVWKIVSFPADSPPAEVVLEDGPVVRGRVVSESGQPIDGARINSTWRRDERGPSGGAFAAGGTANSDGHFAIRVSTDRSLELVVSATGYLDTRVWIETPNQAERTVVLKKPDGALTGRVVDASGNPVSDFQVTVLSAAQSRFPPTRGPAGRAGWGVRADFSTSGLFQHQDGYFSFPELPSGELQIHVSTRGRGGMRKSQVVQIPKGMTADVVIQLEPAEGRRRQ